MSSPSPYLAGVEIRFMHLQHQMQFAREPTPLGADPGPHERQQCLELWIALGAACLGHFLPSISPKVSKIIKIKTRKLYFNPNWALQAVFLLTGGVGGSSAPLFRNPQGRSVLHPHLSPSELSGSLLSFLSGWSMLSRLEGEGLHGPSTAL